MNQAGDADKFRIGTGEREQAVAALEEHLAQGRLTAGEYQERAAAAAAAVTRGDVRPLFDDLPPPHPPFLAPRRTSPVPSVERPAPVFPYPAGDVAALSDKSQTVAGVLQLVFPFGAGRFYTGHTGLAVAQLLVTLFTFGVGALWPFIDGIVLIVNGGTDPVGRRLRT